MGTEIIKNESKGEPGGSEELSRLVSQVLSDVEREGDEALRKYTYKFDGVKLTKFKLSETEIEDIIAKVPAETRELIDTNIERIRNFCLFQKGMYKDMEFATDDGETILGQKIIPIESVGVYVPGGRFPLLSSALMGIIPSKVAGVKRIVAATPPGMNRPHPAVLYGIMRAGATEVLTVGGIQAIGALAYGTESVGKVDKICGPGNKFVNEAKRQVFGTVGIDLLAGPSEVLVVADESASESTVAYDLLAQAEHDVAARSCLVTTSKELALAVNANMQRYIDSLETREILKESWEKHGSVVLCHTIQEALEYTNQYAPEHLELHLNQDNTKLAYEKLHNYGSLFLNESTPVVFSDKLIGTNHTLPTQTAARYTGGLSVGAFLKILTYQKIKGDSALKNISVRAMKQSLVEGLAGHAKSAEIRIPK